MGKFIGRDVSYGMFETQSLTGNGVLTTFNLTYGINNPASILVVYSGNVLQPDVDYSIGAGGSQIVFDTAPATGYPLYIVYLGKELATSPAVNVPTGDKGDITVSNLGETWTIDNQAVTYAKMQNASANVLLGRTSTSGTISEITCTSAGRALLDDPDAAAQRVTLGLGTLATQNGTFSGTSSGTNTGDQNLFSTIAVAGQNNVVADSTSDTLTLVAGTNVTLTTNDTNDSITINASGDIPTGSKNHITVNSTSDWTINNEVVTFAKMQNVTGPTLLGKASGTGSIEQLSLGTGFSFSGTTFNYTPTFSDGTAGFPSFNFASSPTTGFYRPASNTIGVSIQGAERLRIDGTGLILGRSLGSGLMPESGIIKAVDASGTNTSGGNLLFYTGKATGNSTASSFSFYTSMMGDSGDTAQSFREKFRIDNQNIWVGGAFITDSPTSSHQCTLRASSATGTDTQGANLQIHSGIGTGSASSGSIIFYTKEGGGTSGTNQNNTVEKVRINSLGNVGIGATAPQELLHIKGSTPKIRLEDTNGSSSIYSSISADSTSGNISIQADPGNAAASSAIYFDVDGTTRATIDSNGRLGIGTTTPAQALDVVGGFARISVETADATPKVGRIIGRSFNNSESDWMGFDIRGLSGTNEIYYGGGSSVLNSATQHIFFTSASTTTIGGTERFRIASSGNVGVNNSDPSSVLEVGDGSSQKVLTISGGTSGTNGGAALFVRNGSTTNHAFGNWSSIVGGTYDVTSTLWSTGELRVVTGGGANTRMTISNTGNVGIGASSPSEILHLRSSAPRIRLEDTDGGSANVYGQISGNSAAGSVVIQADPLNSAASSSIGFDVDGSTRATIESNGRLGIGTTTPTTRLHVSSTGFDGAKALFESTNSGNSIEIKGVNGAGINDTAYLVLSDGSNTCWVGLTGTNATAGALRFATSSTERMRISSSGLVGINTAAPQHRVDINGRTRSQGGFARTADNSATCSLYVNFDGGGSEYGIGMRPNTDNTTAITFSNAAGGAVGSIGVTSTATSYNQSSDYRLKENVQTITNAISRVKNLNPVKFNYISEPSLKFEGFIAHEIAAVVPYAVTGDKDAIDSNGQMIIQQLDQSKIIPLLTKAIQELLDKVESLEARIEELEA